MLPTSRLVAIAVLTCTLAIPTGASASHKSDHNVFACGKAATAARTALSDHKHCATPEPPPPPCIPEGPTPIGTSVQAGPYLVTKLGPTSVSATHPPGGLNAATEFDLILDNSGYGFPKGADVPWFTLAWSDNEVSVHNWVHFGTMTITAVQFYAYPYPGPLFGGWQQLATPIKMGEPVASSCP